LSILLDVLQFGITSKILIESNRENIPVQYVSHAFLETTNSSNKTILGSGDHQVIGSPSSNQGKYHFYGVNAL
jgi:hypothetical protein